MTWSMPVAQSSQTYTSHGHAAIDGSRHGSLHMSRSVGGNRTCAIDRLCHTVLGLTGPHTGNGLTFAQQTVCAARATGVAPANDREATLTSDPPLGSGIVCGTTASGGWRGCGAVSSCPACPATAAEPWGSAILSGCASCTRNGANEEPTFAARAILALAAVVELPATGLQRLSCFRHDARVSYDH